MNLGTENRNKTIAAVALGALAVIVFVYELWPMFSTPSSPANASAPTSLTRTSAAHPGRTRHMGSRSQSRTAANKKAAIPTDNLDPTLQLQLLAASEQTKYEGSGRNIFVAQAESVDIPQPKASGVTDKPGVPTAGDPVQIYHAPPIAQAPPIPLKFFGFANQPGEAKKIFLSVGDDVFIAGEGEIVDRRYKVLRISPTSVQMQDVVSSSPPQTIPLTQG